MTCTVTSLAANTTAIFEITAFAPFDVLSGTVLTNNVTADADNANPVSDTEETTVEQQFGPPADLQISKVGRSRLGGRWASHLHHRDHQ